MKLYGLEWMPGAVGVGAVLMLLIVPSFALIALVGAISRRRTCSYARSVGVSRSGTSQRKARFRSPRSSHSPQAPPTTRTSAYTAEEMWGFFASRVCAR